MKLCLRKADGRYYKIQDIGIPTEIFVPYDTGSSTVENASVQTMECNYAINLVELEGCMSNAELAEKVIQEIDDTNVRIIKEIAGVIRCVLEYLIVDANGHQVEHSSIVEIMHPSYKMMPLGVNDKNECVYRQIEEFDLKARINSVKQIPVGIMTSTPSKYKLEILGLSFYQATSEDTLEVQNNAVYGNRYSFQSTTIRQIIKDSVCIFDTNEAGVAFAPITFRTLPRRLTLNFKISLGDVVNLYDDAVIQEILNKNYDEGSFDFSGNSGDMIGTGNGTGGLVIDVTGREDDEYDSDEEYEDPEETPGGSDTGIPGTDFEETEREEDDEDSP